MPHFKNNLFFSGYENWGAIDPQSGEARIGQDNVGRESNCYFDRPDKESGWYPTMEVYDFDIEGEYEKFILLLTRHGYEVS